MTARNEPSPEFRDLIDQFLDGSIVDDAMHTLDLALNESQALREYFLQYCQLHIELGTDTTVDERVERSFAAFRQRQSQIANAAQVVPLPGVSSLPTISLWGLGAMMFVCLVAVTAVVWNRRAIDDIAAKQPRVMEVGSLRLDSGTTRMHLPDIGEMVVDGPAEIEMVSAKRMVLNRGKVRVRVNESGKGFVIETRDGEITDLGTEFGVDVEVDCDTKLVVFDGAVDLRVTDFDGEPTRLVGGEAITFSKGRALARLVSIITGTDATFKISSGKDPYVITEVADNLQSSETRNFYEIVPAGMREDALAFADRPRHEWNGDTEKGLPKYLIGADYIKTFADDSIRTDLEIRVTLGCPAKMYVLVDAKPSPPEWLKRDFRKTRDRVGLDIGPWTGATVPRENFVGPGLGIDRTFVVWERVVKEPGVVTLGAPPVQKNPYMYGICAVALDADRAEQSKSGSGE